MSIINDLNKGIKSGSLRLLKELIEKNKYCTINELRKKDKRNPDYVKRDIERFLKLGWIVSSKQPSFLGKNKVPILFTKYKANLENPTIRFLTAKIIEKETEENKNE